MLGPQVPSTDTLPVGLDDGVEEVVLDTLVLIVDDCVLEVEVRVLEVCTLLEEAVLDVEEPTTLEITELLELEEAVLDAELDEEIELEEVVLDAELDEVLELSHFPKRGLQSAPQWSVDFPHHCNIVSCGPEKRGRFKLPHMENSIRPRPSQYSWCCHLQDRTVH